MLYFPSPSHNLPLNNHFDSVLRGKEQILKHIYLTLSSSALDESIVKQTKTYFESLGMTVTLPENLYGKDLLCANSDETRLSHLTTALSDPTVDIIGALHGGYGLTRLIPDLLTLPIPKKEKIFIGFSDNTALHLFLNQVWDWPSIHGPVVSQIAQPTQQRPVGVKSITTALELLENGFSAFYPPPLTPLNERARSVSHLIGKVVGGNLSLLQCSIGTPWQLQTQKKILFLEEVGERGYRVDRMLTHLCQANFFTNVEAILLGDFIGGLEPNGKSLIPEVLQRFADSLSAPVFSIPGCGHGDENFPIPFNVPLSFQC